MPHLKPVLIVIILAALAGLWKVFEKAGEKGWKALIPVYNIYVWLNIIKKPKWWIVIFLIPGVGFMMTMVVSAITAMSFGKKKALDMILAGIFFFAYLPYLGFGKDKFQAPVPDKKEKSSAAHEWLEAITFAVIAATIIRTFFLEAYTIPTSSMEKSLMIGDYLFVSKVNYGARIPMTPISFPFAHNALPGTRNTRSYLDWLTYPYLRLPGFSHIQRHDIVVFNFPEGDTVCSNPGMDNPGYYAFCRDYGRQYVLDNKPIQMPGGDETSGPLLIRPVDKEENYIKRCIGTPGDTLTIGHSQVYIDGKPDEIPGESQYAYDVTTRGGEPLGRLLNEKLDITEQFYPDPSGKPNTYVYFLTRGDVDILKQSGDVVSVTPLVQDSGIYDHSIFPFAPHYKWNVDNFGPLYVPKEGATIKLDTGNLHMYRRIISAYEHNDLEVNGATIKINGQVANSYTFKMNYYFMMGDNRHRSEDSRFWGFVPEDHVVGKASFIWMSLKENSTFSKKFRWKRFFTFVNTEGLSTSIFLPALFVILIAMIYFYIRGRRMAKKS
jgi:signal peptidase I